MCGRYAVAKDPAKLVAEFDAADETEGKKQRPDYNVAPTREVVTVVQRHPRDAEGNVLDDEPAVRALRLMRWGLVPFWAKDIKIGSRMINTRVETVTEKPAFRKAIARRRCLVPADGWFEWRKDGKVKEPFFMTSPDDSSLAFAGIWETWRDPKAEKDAPPLITCSIITTEAVGQLTDIHDRMPMLLSTKDWPTWLDPDRTDVSELLRPPSRDLVDPLELRPISDKVNSVKNNGPELLDPVTPATDLDSQQQLFDAPNPS